MNLETKHIDWIDGAKGVAIICVILLHCLPDLEAIYNDMHIGQAVAVFVFITAYLIANRYHSLKDYFIWPRLKKMLRTMLPPFLFVLMCEVATSPPIGMGVIGILCCIAFYLFCFCKGCIIPKRCYGSGNIVGRFSASRCLCFGV